MAVRSRFGGRAVSGCGRGDWVFGVVIGGRPRGLRKLSAAEAFPSPQRQAAGAGMVVVGRHRAAGALRVRSDVTAWGAPRPRSTRQRAGTLGRLDCGGMCRAGCGRMPFSRCSGRPMAKGCSPTAQGGGADPAAAVSRCGSRRDLYGGGLAVVGARACRPDLPTRCGLAGRTPAPAAPRWSVAGCRAAGGARRARAAVGGRRRGRESGWLCFPRCSMPVGGTAGGGPGGGGAGADAGGGAGGTVRAGPYAVHRPAGAAAAGQSGAHWWGSPGCPRRSRRRRRPAAPTARVDPPSFRGPYRSGGKDGGRSRSASGRTPRPSSPTCGAWADRATAAEPVRSGRSYFFSLPGSRPGVSTTALSRRAELSRSVPASA